jgi:hypothetical protein
VQLFLDQQTCEETCKDIVKEENVMSTVEDFAGTLLTSALSSLSSSVQLLQGVLHEILGSREQLR